MEDVKRGRETQIFGLDVLRFVAATWVMIHHFTFVSWADPGVQGLEETAQFAVFAPLAWLSATGWVGVQVFFVISGYVIALSAHGKSPINFLNRRFLRLVPGVWICATVSLPTLALMHVGIGAIAREYLRSVLFSPIGPWVASSYWTLSVEIVFYGLIFLLLCCDRFRNIEILAGTLGLLSAIGWILYWLYGSREDALGWLARFAGNQKIATFLLLRHGCFFSLGIIIWISGVQGLRWHRLFAIGALSLACTLQIANETAKASTWSGYQESPTLPIVLWCLAILFLIASIMFNQLIAVALGRWAGAIRAIGLSTYPVYLIHQPLGEPALLWLLHLGWQPYPALLTTIAIVLVAAFLVALRLEPWLRAWLLTWIGMLERRLPLRWATLQRSTTGLPSA